MKTIPLDALKGHNFTLKADSSTGNVSVTVLAENKTHAVLETVVVDDYEATYLSPPHIYVMTKRKFDNLYDRTQSTVWLNAYIDLPKRTKARIISCCPEAEKVYLNP